MTLHKEPYIVDLCHVLQACQEEVEQFRTADNQLCVVSGSGSCSAQSPFVFSRSAQYATIVLNLRSAILASAETSRFDIETNKPGLSTLR